MNDAGEVLLTIYERVMGVSPEGELLNTLFGLPLSEHVQCHSCGLTTRQSSYMQYFHSTQVRVGAGGSATAMLNATQLLPIQFLSPLLFSGCLKVRMRAFVSAWR